MTTKNNNEEISAPPATNKPLSFEEWWARRAALSLHPRDRTPASLAWEAREPELAQMREELIEVKDCYINNLEELEMAKAELATERSARVEAVKALERIANSDYRGNRSSESTIAYEALKNVAALAGLSAKESEAVKSLIQNWRILVWNKDDLIRKWIVERATEAQIKNVIKVKLKRSRLTYTHVTTLPLYPNES